MLKNNLPIVVIGALLVLACVGCSQKKILIMASGKIDVAGQTISVVPGSSHREETLLLKGDRVQVKMGTATDIIPINEPGYYLLNLKNDTLVGSYREVAEGEGKMRITQEELQKGIDSLQLLVEGKNVRPESRNFFILPGKVAFIASNTDADLIGPYRSLPTTFEGGRRYEIYKFYTNKEIREVIDKLKAKQQ